MHIIWCRDDWILRGLRSSSCSLLRNLSNHMDRQAHTGDTVIVQSRDMTGRSQTLHAVFFVLTIFPSSKLLHSCLTAYFRWSFLPEPYPCLFCLLLSFLKYFTIFFCPLSTLKISSLSAPKHLHYILFPCFFSSSLFSLSIKSYLFSLSFWHFLHRQSKVSVHR